MYNYKSWSGDLILFNYFSSPIVGSTHSDQCSSNLLSQQNLEVPETSEDTPVKLSTADEFSNPQELFSQLKKSVRREKHASESFFSPATNTPRARSHSFGSLNCSSSVPTKSDPQHLSGNFLKHISFVKPC